jgi:hypothetical protein
MGDNSQNHNKRHNIKQQIKQQTLVTVAAAAAAAAITTMLNRPKHETRIISISIHEKFILNDYTTNSNS